MRDLLRVDANERVDFEDFDYMAQLGLEAHLRQVPDSLLTKPGGQQMWVVSGFAISNPAAQQLRVDKGVALLSRREGVDILPGFVTTEGDPYIILDLSTYSQPDPHGVYVRFRYTQSDTQGRLFWNATSEAEYAQSIPTRLSADWELAVERVNPGAEWMRIGTVTPNTMAIVDERDLYFEGKVDDTYAADGWGSGTDRNSNRALYGITDFQTFTEMIRKVIEEFRSTSGNRRWWEAGVRDLTIDTGGLRVGFSGTPGSGPRIEIGRAETYLWQSSGQFYIYGNSSTLDRIQYEDASGGWFFRANGSPVFDIYGSTNTGAVAIRQHGLRVGFGGAASGTDMIEIGDAQFQIDWNSGDPRINFDTNDFIQYVRSSNVFDWRIAASLRARLHNDGLMLEGGAIFGYIATPTSTLVAMGNSPSFQMLFDYATDNLPKFQWAPGDWLEFNRTSNLWRWYVGSAAVMDLSASGLEVVSGMRVGFAGTPAGADRIELGDANHYFELGGTGPRWQADTSDSMAYHRTNNTWDFTAGAVNSVNFYSTGARISGGLRVGFAGAPGAAGRLELGDANFYLDFLAGINPTLQFASQDKLDFARGSNLWRWYIANSNIAQLSAPSDIGTLSLKDGATTLQALDGDDFRILDGYAQLAENTEGFVLQGLAIYCDEDADTQVYSPAGIARFPNGQVKRLSAVSSGLDGTNSANYVGGSAASDSWAWAWRRIDGTMRFHIQPPTPELKIQVADGGYTVHDYVFIGSFFVRSVGPRVVPWVRDGSRVYCDYKKAGVVASDLWSLNTLAAGGPTAVNEPAASGLAMPLSSVWPHTSAVGIFGTLTESLNNITTDNCYIATDHGRAASNIPGTILRGHGVSARTLIYSQWAEFIAFRAGTTFTYFNASYPVVAGTSRVMSFQALGYFEHLNNVHTNPVYA